MINKRYEEAKEMYQKIGVDSDAAIKKLKEVSISMHCWQGDDVIGFDGADAVSGGIQTTGNYPGRARNYQELMDDIDEVLKLVPGKHRINLHASYAIFDDEKVDRDKLEPKHFKKWINFAKARGLGLDFNPTLFAHPKAEGLTLASPDENIRQFWIDHCKACIKISEYFAQELDSHCLMNIWIPDGLKDIPANRKAPRKRFKNALDEILSIDYDKEKVIVCLESKVFGIGMESYTVGSSEFTLNYAQQAGIAPLLDNGHYHPTEVVSDKLSAVLLFFDKVALHVTRPVRWDSDHVVLFDDETKEIAKEIVSNDALDRVYIGLDFFDASINRISAWTVGMHNMQKALLNALLMPLDTLSELQDKEDFTKVMALSETLKTFPFGDVWNYYLAQNDCPTNFAWFDEVLSYENNELGKRGN